MNQVKEIEKEEDWTLVVKPQTGWLDLHLNDLWRYRDLILLFVKRDFVSVYKQTVLGPLWFIIQPLFTTITFTIIFSNIAKISTDGIPPVLFYLSGLTIWNYFANCLTKTSGTFLINAGIFGKVYFPRLSVPLSVVISNLISFAIQFAFFLLFLAYFKIRYPLLIQPNIYILILPLLLLIMAGIGLGIGIIISSLTTKYRDFAYLIGFGVQLLMYATPVIYPLSTIPEKYKILILANPMASVIETFRYAFLGLGSFNWYHLVYSFVFMIVVLTFGTILFNRVEKSFMDTV